MHISVYYDSTVAITINDPHKISHIHTVATHSYVQYVV